MILWRNDNGYFSGISNHRSISKYKDTPVELDKIEQLLEAARLASSWKNMQCWRFLVLKPLALTTFP
ncbi:MAG: nitroreductase family protein [Deltaproteobacteria bacterium]|nr:nitroreductase family protein [Deltaproteobacteria bacterium]